MSGRGASLGTRRQRWFVFGAVCAVALFADGAASRFAAPAGPATSHPPVDPQGAAWLSGEMTIGRERAVLAALARRYVVQPTSVTIAAQLVERSLASGRTDWLRDFATAIARRLPTASTSLILAEVEYASGGYSAGIHHGAAAYAARPGNAEVDISYAAALASSGDLLRAYAVVARWATDSRSWSSLSELALQRLAVLVTAVSEVRGAPVTTVWMQRSWLSRSHAASSRALSLLSSVAAGRRERKTAVALAKEALRRGARSSIPANTALTVMNAADVSSPDHNIVGRVEGVCQQLPADQVARADCLISALERAADLGLVGAASSLYRILARDVERVPLLSMRLAAVAVPLLELTGATREAAELAEESTRAAAVFGDRQLRASFEVRLARARRLVGDYPAARAAASRALAIAPEESLVRQRALRETHIAEQRGEGVASPQIDLSRTVALLGSQQSGFSFREDGQEVSRARSFEGAIKAAQQGVRQEALGDTDKALKHYLEALDAVASMRRTSSVGILELVDMRDVWQDVTRRSLGLAFRVGDAATGLGLLERHRSTFPPVHPRTTADIFELPSSSALIAFVVGPESSWVVALRDGRWRVIPLPVSKQSLRTRVRLWRALAKSNTDAVAWTAIGDALVHDLMGPLEAAGALANVSRLYVVPDDVLHLLPFATLLADRGGGPNGDHLVTQSPSIAVVTRALSTRPRRGRPVAFGLGGAGVFEEVRTIRGAGGRVFLGSRATESEWRRQAQTASTVYFGGHVRPLSVDSAAGGLQLRADSRSDGLLTIEEIVAAPLPGATVVLIGCDTATRLEEPGPASYYSHQPSLGEAFLLAGARSVVGNLWPITEEDAQLLVGEFHRSGGVRRGAAALEEARRKLRARFPAQPRRWAGAVWLGATGSES